MINEYWIWGWFVEKNYCRHFNGCCNHIGICQPSYLIHEIIGIGLVFLIILHINFNKNYFKAIPKGKYTLKRTIDLIINIGLLISLSITIISGICSSQKSLRNLTIGKYKILHIHKSSSIISLIFLGLHLLTTRKKLFREIKKLHWLSFWILQANSLLLWKKKIFFLFDF